jgi:hypothetical protein
LFIKPQNYIKKIIKHNFIVFLSSRVKQLPFKGLLSLSPQFQKLI